MGYMLSAICGGSLVGYIREETDWRFGLFVLAVVSGVGAIICVSIGI